MKDKTIKIRLTELELAMLKQICVYGEESMSEFVRKIIHSDYEQLYPQEYYSMYPQTDDVPTEKRVVVHTKPRPKDIPPVKKMTMFEWMEQNRDSISPGRFRECYQSYLTQ